MRNEPPRPVCGSTPHISCRHLTRSTAVLRSCGACSALAHVPLAQYSSNLRNITSQLQAAGVQRVVLLTPPPVNEAAPDAVGPGEVSKAGRCWDLGRNFGVRCAVCR
eukprot:GHRQ01022050.1.p4 GENE.GHRQ01022050.1~~GHRQ01022050.1.p4  ORF type:complete len:107 (-),score=25.61 GHRQ01022050.1:1128-1448(-)